LGGLVSGNPHRSIPETTESPFLLIFCFGNEGRFPETTEKHSATYLLTLMGLNPRDPRNPHNPRFKILDFLT